MGFAVLALLAVAAGAAVAGESSGAAKPSCDFDPGIPDEYRKRVEIMLTQADQGYVTDKAGDRYPSVAYALEDAAREIQELGYPKTAACLRARAARVNPAVKSFGAPK